MIWDLIKGLALSGVSFLVIIAVCAVLGKIAQRFSRYQNIK